MWAGWNVCAALYVDGCEASAQNVGIDLSFPEYYGFLLMKSGLSSVEVLLAGLCIGLLVCNQNGFFSQTFRVLSETNKTGYTQPFDSRIGPAALSHMTGFHALIEATPELCQ